MSEWINSLIKIAGIFIAGILMILLGKYNQKKKLVPGLKVFFQIIIALLIIAVGIKIEFLRNYSGGYWYLNNLSIPITIIWLLTITNSIGQTDELGDITPITVFIAALTFFIVSIFQQQGLIIAEVLSALLIIFSLAIILLKRRNTLEQNNYFSSYYMFFGFILAIIAIVGVLKSTAALTLLTPLLILGFPIVDTSYSFIANYLRDDYLGNVSESRLRQQLIEQGFSWKGANMIIIASCIYLSIVAVIVSVKEDLYLFTAMIGTGYLVYYWISKRVLNGQSIIDVDEYRQKVELFGVPIDRMNCNKVLERIDGFVKERQSHFVITPDTLAILRARKDRQYLDIAKKADLVTPDGAGILWATAFLNEPLPERITGIDMINYICQLAVKKKYKIYLLGAEAKVIKKAVENLEEKYPGIEIVGYHHGYFNNISIQRSNQEIESDIIKDIVVKKPDFLLVGMGVPKQEIWIYKYKDKLGVPVCIGIGGSFDVLSGKIPRAPLWMQNHGMEWIFRLIKEPKRLKRAILLPCFIWLFLLGKIELLFREER
ncbi:MAG: WecB/TagA/CpsF family glycosyltransferase [Atribacterota bacterium]|nr:WecB/TagA/CpsF family glycosyltransferase [Atribacterota bacterium]